EGWEFSEVLIDAGGTLVVTGARPCRIFARGNLVQKGIINLTGTTPTPHVSNLGGGGAFNSEPDPLASAPGGTGGAGGPGAGAGGQGADRIDMTGSEIEGPMQNAGGILYPGAVNVGRSGAGVGGIPDGTGGKGGVNWPPALPTHNLHTNADFGDAEQSIVGVDENCRVAMVGGSGSGGAYALEGDNGIGYPAFVETFPGLLSTTPPDTGGGDNTNLNLEAPGSAPSVDNQRNLEFWRKHLRGGSGGGGGGTSIYGSHNNASNDSNGCDNGAWSLFPFWDHSAAGGGGGGGAVMMVAGRTLSLLNGRVSCSGGDGGSATVPGAAITLCTQSGNLSGPEPDCEKYAAPGGGGAGGAVRLQARTVNIAGLPGMIDVQGGVGGLGAGDSTNSATGPSSGGDGSPGLVRIEYTGFVDQATDAAVWGPSILPSLPADTGFNTPFTSAAILSIGEWDQQEFRPETYSGAQSCWIKPEATQAVFLGLDFVPDAGSPVTLDDFGWNMDIIYDVPGVGETNFPYRGLPPFTGAGYDDANYPLAALGNVDFETYLGTTLNHGEGSLSSGSLLVMRFQGVRSAGVISDFCDVDLLSSEVEVGSLTPYVSHPAFLNDFFPTPNMIRFSVVFDEQLAGFNTVVEPRIMGVTNLRIRVQPK
ncbi:MAG: hypothetical protein ACI9F9_001817, partial [Candidatus Paceibacteria bacterium]